MQKTKMTIKEAVKWCQAFKNAKFKCIAPNQVLEAMNLLDSQDRCLNCGKKMKNYKGDKYSWKCSCMPDDIVISKG